ncbi:branched-chain amino acid ABC transporter permease [Jannaschia sp. 2305UL9-9]|uniref:branched-chain amino acid ABC transporter permease n=1 Tax=Jannaschia sp. 2305UL9-9 TaxID=3121638 RepID=UPI003528A6B3
MDWINAIVQGALLGGLYALFAAGLSLMFGVMRFVNLAHGDFIVLAAFGALALVETTGFFPFWTLIALVPMFALGGYLLQRSVFNRITGQDLLPAILVTFGLSVILQNVMLEAFSADSRRIPAGALDTAALALPGGIGVGIVSLLMFLAAVVSLGSLDLFMSHTRSGRLLRATSDDQEIVGLMGANRAHLFALATAIAGALIALAGVLMAVKTNFDASAGPVRLLFAFEAVIIGGLGSLWGTLLGGILLGVAQAVGAQIDPGFQILAGHLVFLLVLALRPEGLMPRKA